MKTKILSKNKKVNTLTQLENLKSYSFLKDALEKGQINAYALWLDIYTGDVYVFNYEEKRFVVLNDDSYKKLLKVKKN